MRAFAAALATETNTFGAIPTSRADFEDMFYAPPGTHPAAPSWFTAPVVAARDWAARGAFDLVEGTATWAEPSGLVSREGYESLRDEILEQLCAAMPVDLVLLGMHGAMVADGYTSCETDMAHRVREIVGPDAALGIELDMHCQMTPELVAAATVIVLFKENPHVDFLARAHDVVRLTLAAAKGEVRPTPSLFDCRSISRGSFQTFTGPGRALVDRILATEGTEAILSISIVHGFQAADVPELGVKVLVYTDDDAAAGDALAERLGHEILALKDPDDVMLPTDIALDAAMTVAGGPVVIADRWDNPGGGVAGDSTFMLRALMNRPDVDAALGALWDPMSVRICRAAGVGATIPLRIGAKTGPGSGEPIDATVTVTALCDDLETLFAESTVRMGAAAAVRIGRLDLVLISRRTQTMHRDTFIKLGIDPAAKKIVVVKSSNHFYADFGKFAAKVLYVDCDGPWPHDPFRTPYTRLRRPIAPLDVIAWH